MEKKVVRIALVALAVLAIGVLVLPSTMTLFAGQHTWYYKEALPCEKCHADVAEEFSSAANYHPPGATYPIWEACVLCHQVEPLYPGDVNYNEGKHAATIVPCDYCHWPEANAFTNDPHLPFVQTAENDNLMPNGTEACVACHTHAQLDISFEWMKYMTFEFQVNASADRELDTTDEANFWTNIAHHSTYEYGFGAMSDVDQHIIIDYGAYVYDANGTIPYGSSTLDYYENHMPQR